VAKRPSLLLQNTAALQFGSDFISEHIQENFGQAELVGSSLDHDTVRHTVRPDLDFACDALRRLCGSCSSEPLSECRKKSHQAIATRVQHKAKRKSTARQILAKAVKTITVRLA